MDNKEIANKLTDLVHLDVDAINAYEQAMKNIDVPMIVDELESFKGDHERHVKTLTLIIQNLGEQPPEAKPDIKGFFIKGFTAVRSMTGTEGALKAMKTNEELTTKTYDKALSWDLTEDIRRTVQENYQDEQRHLHSIERMLNERAWEAAGAHP